VPDRYIGRRTPNGGWRWEAEPASRPRNYQHILLIALVAAAGVATACLLIAAILLASDSESGSGSPDGPSAAFLAWNPIAGEWQAGDLNGDVTNPTFLVTLDDSGESQHQVTVSYECSSLGAVSLTEPAASEAVMTAPGPQRPRPDSTALNGALGAWGATFSDAPAWEQDTPCAGLQTLSWAAVNRGQTSQFIWSVLPPAPVGDAGGSLSVSANIDGAVQTISLSY
jgi:hypothetical protein